MKKNKTNTEQNYVLELLSIYSKTMTDLYNHDEGRLEIPVRKKSDLKINTDEFLKMLNKNKS